MATQSYGLRFVRQGSQVIFRYKKNIRLRQLRPTVQSEYCIVLRNMVALSRSGILSLILVFFFVRVEAQANNRPPPAFIPPYIAPPPKRISTNPESPRLDTELDGCVKANASIFDACAFFPLCSTCICLVV